MNNMTIEACDYVM